MSYLLMKNELPIHNSVDGNHHPENEREKCKHFIISGEKSLSNNISWKLYAKQNLFTF